MEDIPAFPRPMGLGSFTYNDAQEGMTLRDYFAGQALIGFVSNVSDADMQELANKTKVGKFITSACYTISDAMLKAREKTQ